MSLMWKFLLLIYSIFPDKALHLQKRNVKLFNCYVSSITAWTAMYRKETLILPNSTLSLSAFLFASYKSQQSSDIQNKFSFILN